MKFTLTNHAEKRLSERGIPDPNTVSCVVAKNKAKQLIKDQCKLNKYKNDCVYFRTNDRKAQERAVYVCKVSGVGEYLVLTAFRLEYPLKGEN